ncbi:MAG: hypothetical protein WC712_05445 [Candidatus Brocadiia bacterium]
MKTAGLTSVIGSLLCALLWCGQASADTPESPVRLGPGINCTVSVLREDWVQLPMSDVRKGDILRLQGKMISPDAWGGFHLVFLYVEYPGSPITVTTNSRGAGADFFAPEEYYVNGVLAGALVESPKQLEKYIEQRSPVESLVLRLTLDEKTIELLKGLPRLKYLSLMYRFDNDLRPKLDALGLQMIEWIEGSYFSARLAVAQGAAGLAAICPRVTASTALRVVATAAEIIGYVRDHPIVCAGVSYEIVGQCSTAEVAAMLANTKAGSIGVHCWYKGADAPPLEIGPDSLPGCTRLSLTFSGLRLARTKTGITSLDLTGMDVDIAEIADAGVKALKMLNCRLRCGDAKRSSFPTIETVWLGELLKSDDGSLALCARGAKHLIEEVPYDLGAPAELKGELLVVNLEGDKVALNRVLAMLKEMPELRRLVLYFRYSSEMGGLMPIDLRKEIDAVFVVAPEFPRGILPWKCQRVVYPEATNITSRFLFGMMLFGKKEQ